MRKINRPFAELKSTRICPQFEETDTVNMVTEGMREQFASFASAALQQVANYTL